MQKCIWRRLIFSKGNSFKIVCIILKFITRSNIKIKHKHFQQLTPSRHSPAINPFTLKYFFHWLTWKMGTIFFFENPKFCDFSWNDMKNWKFFENFFLLQKRINFSIFRAHLVWLGTESPCISWTIWECWCWNLEMN